VDVSKVPEADKHRYSIAYSPRRSGAKGQPSASDAFEYVSSMTLIGRPAHPFTKLLLRPIALFASLNWEIGRNRAKFRASRACAVLSVEHCTVARRN
jgi:hypothetical protein